jgi:phosphonate transport system substrate-binding protein
MYTIYGAMGRKTKKMHYRWPMVCLCLCALLMSGCKKQEPHEETKKAPLQGELKIGLIPEQDIFRQISRYEPLANYLSERIGMQIILKVLPRYGNIINNFTSDSLDGAFFGSFTYTLAHSKLGVEVLARPENLDGTSTYFGLIFVRKDSGIRNAMDMKGKTFAFVDRATTAGHLLPMSYFRKNGIADYKRHLKEFYFAGTHEDTIYDVLNLKADIGAAKNTIFYKLAKTDHRVNDKLLIIEKSPHVPSNGLAVRKDLRHEVKVKLSNVLLSMHEDPEGRKTLEKLGARKFIKTSDSDYEPVYNFVKEIGLDLNTYNYMNE